MNPAEFSLTISPTLSKAAPVVPLQKNGAPIAGKAGIQRIDLEPIYTQLKPALGGHWTGYKTCLSQYVLGNINQAELSWVLQPMLSSVPGASTTADPTKPQPSTLWLHNNLISGLYANTLRDPPPSEVAPWVVATDKPTAASKNSGAGSGASDQVEERLKREVMGLHPRERKRIKSLKAGGKAVRNGLQEMQDYHNALAVKPPPQVISQGDGVTPQSAGPSGTAALGKTNLDLEIRRKYAQPLASETLEFPTLEAIQARIEPISYEEGLTSGVLPSSVQSCAELVEQATEVFVKEMLSSLLKNARSNASGAVGAQTARYKRRLRKEENDAERGAIQRNAAGMLPVEMEAQANKEPLDMHDLRLSCGLSNEYLRTDRFLQESIMLNHYPQLDLDLKTVNGKANGTANAAVNGAAVADPNAMVVDDDYGDWQGATSRDRESLFGTLDDCLLAAG